MRAEEAARNPHEFRTRGSPRSMTAPADPG
jgi:hypothetical protein